MNPLQISQETVNTLRRVVDSLEIPPSSGIHTRFWREVGELVNGAINDDEFVHTIRSLLDVNAETSPGYVIVEGFEASEEASRIPLSVVALVGTPFALIPRLGYWQSLDVDTRRPAHKFGGTGYNHFHTDVANSTCPPRILCLFCIRLDPTGGGFTIVSDVRKLPRSLTSEDIDALMLPQWVEGQFFDMQGVGSELNPFPMLSYVDGQLFPRFTAKLLASLPDAQERQILTRANAALVVLQQELLLKPGQLLIVNQRSVVHGRRELGPGQELIPECNRRFLLQGYAK